MGWTGEEVGPLAHGLTKNGKKRKTTLIYKAKWREKERASKISRQSRSAKELGNTPLMALLSAEKGLLAVSVGAWRIRRDEVRNRSSPQKTQSCTTAARDFSKQQWECSLFSFLLSQHTNQHMDTVSDGYRDIYTQTHCTNICFCVEIHISLFFD